MQINESDIYRLNYFTYKKPFTGSCGNMRYRIIQTQEEGQEAQLSADVYPQPYCWEDTPKEQIQGRDFPFSEEGRTQMIAWLNEKYKEFE